MRSARILIFDEPTAVLTEEESAALFTILRKLREDGRAIIFITHKLREALALADTVSVLRRGKLVATLSPEETSVAELGRLMVGRTIGEVRPDLVGAPDAAQGAGPADNTGGGAPLLAVQDAVMGPKTTHAVPLRGLTIEAHPGEIVSILGVDGNGQQEIVSLLTGAQSPDQGTVTLAGRDLTRAGARCVPGCRARRRARRPPPPRLGAADVRRAQLAARPHGTNGGSCAPAACCSTSGPSTRTPGK